MNNGPINVLLVEDNPGDIRLIKEMLKEVEEVKFNIKHVNRVSSGLKYLEQDTFDIILLDLLLPDSEGFSTFEKIHIQAPEVAIIVFTGNSDKQMGIKAVREGAQDYLIKGQVTGNLLERSIHYALERQWMMKNLREMSLTDELTDLYNRRGFLLLARQQVKLADRTKKKMALLFADLDNLKWINDTLGHKKGDQAIADISDILRGVFRKSNIIARIGGDEFVILAIDTSYEEANILAERLQKNLVLRNKEGSNPYELSISIGIVSYDPYHPCTIEEFLTKADSVMYEQKRLKKSKRIPSRTIAQRPLFHPMPTLRGEELNI